MSLYTGISIATLSEALVLAQAALPALERGEAVASIATGDNRIAFVPTTPAALRLSIRDLQRAIAIANGQTASNGPAVALWTR